MIYSGTSIVQSMIYCNKPIIQSITDNSGKRPSNKAKSIHLVGTDRPEATMIYSGFFNEVIIERNDSFYCKLEE